MNFYCVVQFFFAARERLRAQGEGFLQRNSSPNAMLNILSHSLGRGAIIFSGQVVARALKTTSSKMERKTGRRGGAPHCCVRPWFCFHDLHFHCSFSGARLSSCHSSTLNSTILSVRRLLLSVVRQSSSANCVFLVTQHFFFFRSTRWRLSSFLCVL